MRLNRRSPPALSLLFITSLPSSDLFIHEHAVVLLSLKISLSLSGPLLVNGINSRSSPLGHNMDSLEGE